ncbi:Thiopurine S-methyltransferase [Trichormus variabilis ATCC 29413]|uniref:Thiopurine S-methyltransferase n=2 Tax=Anabaena variabilis TaxID=264691 RepID=Q3M4D1_TRIV2|nr:MULTISPECIES: class I SAM-dependent methyltransferase [Nostocaceae]ABA24155.1 Thiopurine S-methyltransferase [Trichormus variabilis ATCC 29413]MBC1215410.1 class I SAM-dependent methyltransferase [Trichormus variabilis ARAD]MBC1255000.1 class I SAM-dependent methyltransferase [Trichormus variabilis V5]MBC1266246.1 class I SAM-dependent methyltransferase [Trichormus variabilis FSR]MBC1301985.1 class I SAM-dependent methyltransferase [Trichormus variabilis N2B]
MLEQQKENLRFHIQQLANEAVQKSEPLAWFEVVYAEAQGDTTQIPWAKLTPHPYLQEWLTNHQPFPSGQKALVIGCGLGDDAEALSKLGFAVTAFDISPTAIAWCGERFPNSNVNYIVADLLAIPPQWHLSFDFVFECRNIQALPLNVRAEVITSVASVVAPDGTLLLINRVRETEAEPSGPPWPLSESELKQLENLGLQPIEQLVFLESEQVDVKQVRIEYRRCHMQS